ncbi:bis(5'-nucleosyl)-tetraphosphatase [asymmetrical]-like [Lineus longissimus]|uniref:bis(5'-nucleosyl)-tetraphosphatase [asymmetrical]-like n=1 Tax=Lineus longissimus TaxID=88925 RepID=UPI002B4D2F29
MATPKGTLVAAGFIIFRRWSQSIQYLQLQTSYGKHHWTPPKGHVDPGESELETAMRETEEEAGLKRNDYKVISGFKKTLHYHVGGNLKRVEYWLAELKNPETPVILSDEHQDYKWLEITDAQKYVFYKEMQDALAAAHEYVLKQ